MFQYEQSVYVQTPVGEAFAFLTDQTQLHTWLQGLVSSEVVGGGPVRLGATLRQVRVQGGREMKGEVEVVEHRTPSLHAVRCNIMGVTTTFSFHLSAEASGTRVTLQSQFRGAGFAKLLERMVGGMCKDCNEQSLAALRRQIEFRCGVGVR